MSLMLNRSSTLKLLVEPDDQYPQKALYPPSPLIWKSGKPPLVTLFIPSSVEVATAVDRKLRRKVFAEYAASVVQPQVIDDRGEKI